APEVGEADAAAIGAGLLDESNWLRRVDRDGADRTCPRVHEARGVPVGPDLDDAAACDELEVLTAAPARDLLIVRALVQDADPDAVAKARAIEGDAGHDREELLLALDAELAEPGDALLDHVPLEAIAARPARKRDADRHGHRGERRHARRKPSARAVPDHGTA